MANRGVNKVIILGNLGGDPDTRTMPNSGTVLTTMTIYTNESWKDRETGETVEKSEKHRVVMFGKLAEIAAQYLRSGSQVYIEGKLQTRNWDDDQGITRWTTEIKADQMQMLGGRMTNDNSSKNASSSQSTSDNDVSTDEFDENFDFLD